MAADVISRFTSWASKRDLKDALQVCNEIAFLVVVSRLVVAVLSLVNTRNICLNNVLDTPRSEMPLRT